MKFYSRPTDAAEADFVEWLRSVLKQPDNAERHAKAAIDEHDWGRIRNLEIRGHYTATGNPATYSFSDDDMIMEEVEA